MDATIEHDRPIRIRQARPADHAEAAGLIFLTGEGLYTFAFYSEKEKTLKILQALFQKGSNEFTFEDACVATVNGRIGGLIFFLDRAKWKRNKRGMGLKIIKTMGLWETIKRMSRFKRVERLFQDMDDKTVYIQHLATVPGLRGRGIGTALIEFCERTAIEAGFSKLALDVATDNRNAIRLYEKLGFRIHGTIEDRVLQGRFNFQGLYRMVKKINH
jgi:ribosomal protein S18 acetylase RimI-like enzyme